MDTEPILFETITDISADGEVLTKLLLKLEETYEALVMLTNIVFVFMCVIIVVAFLYFIYRIFCNFV